MSEINVNDQALLDSIIAGTVIEINEPAVKNLRDYALAYCPELVSAQLPNATAFGQYAFAYDKKLRSVDGTSAGKIGDNCFYRCERLETVLSENASNLGPSAFGSTFSLKQLNTDQVNVVGVGCFSGTTIPRLNFPRLTSNNVYSFGSSLSGGTYGPSVVDFSKKMAFSGNSFISNWCLVAVILRNETMSTLYNTDAFTNTPIKSGPGYIYVPDDLVSAYQTASNWSTFSSKIKALSEYQDLRPFETITDTWEEIFAAEDDGTYSTRYSVGDIKCVEIGGRLIPMRIVGFDCDDLASGTGKAKITWLGRSTYLNKGVFNSDEEIADWDESSLRNYLNNEIIEKVEAVVKEKIKPVEKSFKSILSGGTVSCIDKIWIPSYREMFGDDTIETYGVDYTSIFSEANSRKLRLGYSHYTTPALILRSRRDDKNYYYINSNGAASNMIASGSALHITIGFCT